MLFNAASSQAAISSVTTSCETNSTNNFKMAARLDHQTVLFKQFSRHLEAKKAAAIEKELAKRVEKEKNKVVVLNQKPTISKKKTRMKTRANSVSDFKVDDSGSSTSSEEEGEREVLGSSDDDKKYEAGSEEGDEYIVVKNLSQPGLAKYLPYLKRTFLDKDDKIKFRVHSLCRLPGQKKVMFQYFELPAGAGKKTGCQVKVPQHPDDFEYSSCDDMLKRDSWVKWL